MYPEDYLGSYEIIEENGNRVKIRSKIKATRCRHCDQDSIQSNGPIKRTVYDIDSRTGEIVTIEATHYRYRCNNPGCNESFTLDVLPTKCFPNTPSDGRTNKSKSHDILNRAMDYLLFGSDANGKPVTVSATAEKYGYDRKVISTELHARVNRALEEHVVSNEPCAQAALVPFTYRGVTRCAIMGYIQDGDGLRPVLYDIRDKYTHDDLMAYLKEYRYQGLIVPEITYADMDDALLELVYKLYVEDYQNPHEEFLTGIVKAVVKEKISSVTPGDIPNQLSLIETFKYYQKRIEANLYDKVLQDVPVDGGKPVLVNARFAENDVDFYTILEDWWDEVSPDVIAKELQPLYDSLYAYADSIDVSMTHYREDGVCPEAELGFVQYFHKNNVGFEEMRFRVHCLSKNKQQVPFMQLISGEYRPPISGKTLQRYYIDLRELNDMFRE